MNNEKIRIGKAICKGVVEGCQAYLQIKSVIRQIQFANTVNKLFS